MLSKRQQVFASAHKDVQRLTWNFHSENSTKKMLLRTKQHTCSRKVVKTKVEKILIHGKRTYSRKGSSIFFTLSCHFQT